MTLEWERVPDLRRPIVVAALEGFFDFGAAATAAVTWLKDRHHGQRIARVDPDQYFDFQTLRPHAYIASDGERAIQWPENEWFAAEVEGRHDLVLLIGFEPHLRWRSFCEGVLEVTTDCNAELVVTLGALPAGVPHTRPTPVQGSSSSVELTARLGLDKPSYSGPTGVVGALHELLDRNSLPAISLRASVPHYVSGPANPKATRALLQRLEQVTGLETGFGELDSGVLEWEERVSSVVAEDDEVEDYVSQLEEEVDRAAEEELPSGDDLAAEFEQFLRDRDEDSGSGQ